MLGCDQVLVHDGAILSKPQTPGEALAQLRRLSGQTHTLLSAAVVHGEGADRSGAMSGGKGGGGGEARLTMRRPVRGLA